MYDPEKLNQMNHLMQQEGLLSELRAEMRFVHEQQKVLFDLLSKMDVKIDDIHTGFVKLQTERNMLVGLSAVIGGIFGGMFPVIFNSLKRIL